MAFWTYMLHCADQTFYVGHSDNLEGRLSQHEQGETGGYTSTRLPVKLVWHQDFPTRLEALAAERQIKGWTKAKKLALIRGDWDLISALAQSSEKKKGGPFDCLAGAQESLRQAQPERSGGN